MRWPLCRTGLSFYLLGYSKSVLLFVQVLMVGLISLEFMYNLCLFFETLKGLLHDREWMVQGLTGEILTQKKVIRIFLSTALSPKF